jgi:hypothetical protein
MNVAKFAERACNPRVSREVCSAMPGGCVASARSNLRAVQIAALLTADA